MSMTWGFSIRDYVERYRLISSNTSKGFFRDLHDVIFEDFFYSRAIEARITKAEELKEGFDLSDPSDFRAYISLVEKELNITKISTNGDPISRYYKIESPEDFYREKAETSRLLRKQEVLFEKNYLKMFPLDNQAE